jgi:homoaconitase/3-isopropylmalate dehydratase large subunit
VAQAPFSNKTLLDKLWDLHVVADLGNGWSLLHIDRHLLHDLSGTAGLFALTQKGMTVANPDLPSQPLTTPSRPRLAGRA